MRVLLADGFAVYRKGMAAVLKRIPDIDVVGEASDAAQAVRLCAESAPDAVVLAANLPGGSVWAARSILALRPSTRICFLMETKQDVRWYEEAGAPVHTYLTRATGVRELLQALVPSRVP